VPDQSQIDQEASGSDLEQRVAVLEDTIATLRRNLLEPAMTRPGLMRYGANAMQLDNNGAQVKGATTVPPTTGVWFVNELVSTPSTSYPRGQLDGYAIASPAAGLAEIQALASSTYYAKVYSYTGTATNPEAGMYVTDGTNTSTAILVVSSSAVNGRFVLDNATMRLASFTAAPTTLADGDIWYDSVADVAYLRANGATVAIATGTLKTVATDTIWDAAGDLAVGTGADTAAKLAKGTDGTRLVSDATGMASPFVGWKSFFYASANANGGPGSTSINSNTKYVRFTGLTGDMTATLYSAAAIGVGDCVLIKRSDTSGYTATVNTTSSQTIDGALSITLAPYESVLLVSDGSNWERN